MTATPTNIRSTLQVVSGPTRGTLEFHPDGTFRYKPNPGFVGVDQFTYRASDGISPSTAATVTIHVQSIPPVNRPPIGNPDSYATSVDTPLAVDRPFATIGERIYQSTPPHATDRGGSVVAASQFIASRFYVPAPARTSRIGGTLVGSGNVFGAIVALTGPNDFPDSYDLSTSDVLGTALIPAATAAPYIVSAPLNVALTAGWYAIVFGSGRFGATGSGAAPSNGGGAGQPAPGTHEVLFTSGQGWETQYGHSEHLFLDGTAIAGVLANDLDEDGDLLTAEVIEGPIHGTLDFRPDGTFRYAPNAGFSGVDGFQYRPRDASSAGNTTFVSLAVGGAAGPSADDDQFTLDEDAVLEVGADQGVLDNDSGQGLVAVLVTGPAHGQVLLAADGSLRYAPDSNFAGIDRFQYRVAQGSGFSAPAEVTLTVRPIPDEPAAVNDQYDVRAGETLEVNAGTRPATYVYWTDSNTNKVGRVDLTTGEVEFLFVPTAGPHAIAVDTVNGWLYWGVGAAEYRIYRSRLDGSERQLLPRPDCTDNCAAAADLALDVTGGKMYWTTSGGVWRESRWQPSGTNRVTAREPVFRRARFGPGGRQALLDRFERGQDPSRQSRRLRRGRDRRQPARACARSLSTFERINCTSLRGI